MVWISFSVTICTFQLLACIWQMKLYSSPRKEKLCVSTGGVKIADLVEVGLLVFGDMQDALNSSG